MRVIDCAQGTPEWRQWRAGRVTASRVADVMATIKTGEAATRRDYRMQLVAERLTGAPQENGYVSPDMQFGIEQEPFARLAYEGKFGSIVNEVGFCIPDDPVLIGASPDGLIEDDGVAEIKCPKTATHIAWLSVGIAPAQHIPQMQMQMWVTKRKWCEFISFDPRLPDALRLFVVRVPRDDYYIEQMQASVKKFLAEVEAEVSRLMEFCR